MAKKQKPARKPWKFNFGHMHSQKFAGLIFGIIACFCAGLFLISEPTTSAVIMGIVGLYTAFVGGRAWSDNAAMRYGGAVNTTDVETSTVKRLPKKEEKKEEDDREID
jgi:hypothetical protein